MKRPELDDDEYYPISIQQNTVNFIDDITEYCDYLEAKIASLTTTSVHDADKFYHPEDD